MLWFGFLYGNGVTVLRCMELEMLNALNRMVALDLIWGAKVRFQKKNWSLPGGSAQFSHKSEATSASTVIFTTLAVGRHALHGSISYLDKTSCTGRT